MGSVGYLLDTHTFLWAAQDDARLSQSAKEAMSAIYSLVSVLLL